MLGILAVQALVSFAIIRYFLTERAATRLHRFKTLLAPVIGGFAQIGACYLLIKYRGDLSGAGDNWFIKYLPWFVLAIFLSGIAVGAVLAHPTRRSTRRSAASSTRTR